MSDQNRQAKPPELPVALTIAGSDSSAGAGLQADLKTFAAHGAYGICAVTSVVAEIPGNVTAFDPVDPTLLRQQLDTLDSGFRIAALKTGMLATPEIVAAVCVFLESRPGLPLVVDPVMVATSGDRLLAESAIDLYKTRLLPLARIATPNLAEAEDLLGETIDSLEAMKAAAPAFSQQFGGCAVALKGGHLSGDQDAVDVFFDGETVAELRSPRIPDLDTHGTGCTFSAAITANLALGKSLPEAVANAKTYITAAIGQSHRWAGGKAGAITALNHFPEAVSS